MEVKARPYRHAMRMAVHTGQGYTEAVDAYEAAAIHPFTLLRHLGHIVLSDVAFPNEEGLMGLDALYQKVNVTLRTCAALKWTAGFKSKIVAYLKDVHECITPWSHAVGQAATTGMMLVYTAPGRQERMTNAELMHHMTGTEATQRQRVAYGILWMNRFQNVEAILDVLGVSGFPRSFFAEWNFYFDYMYMALYWTYVLLMHEHPAKWLSSDAAVRSQNHSGNGAPDIQDDPALAALLLVNGFRPEDPMTPYRAKVEKLMLAFPKREDLLLRWPVEWVRVRMAMRSGEHKAKRARPAVSTEDGQDASMSTKAENMLCATETCEAMEPAPVDVPVDECVPKKVTFDLTTEKAHSAEEESFEVSVEPESSDEEELSGVFLAPKASDAQESLQRSQFRLRKQRNAMVFIRQRPNKMFLHDIVVDRTPQLYFPDYPQPYLVKGPFNATWKTRAWWSVFLQDMLYLAGLVSTNAVVREEGTKSIYVVSDYIGTPQALQRAGRYARLLVASQDSPAPLSLILAKEEDILPEDAQRAVGCHLLLGACLEIRKRDLEHIHWDPYSQRVFQTGGACMFSYMFTQEEYTPKLITSGATSQASSRIYEIFRVHTDYFISELKRWRAHMPVWVDMAWTDNMKIRSVDRDAVISRILKNIDSLYDAKTNRLLVEWC